MTQAQIESSLASLKKEIKEKSQEKQLCAKAFKTVDKTSSEFSTLKAQMSLISRELKALESELKNHLNQNKKSTSKPTPSKPTSTRFLPLENISERTVSSIIECRNPEKWDDYVEHHPRSTPYHLYQWQSVIRDSFQHDASYLTALDNQNNIIGILPIIWQDTRLFGRHGISIPYFNYGEPLTDNTTVASALIDHANSLRKQRDFSHIEIRTANKSLSSAIKLPYQSNKISMVLNLPTTTDAFRQDIGSKVRAQLKQCEKFKLEYKEGGKELIDDFYTVYSNNMRDLGTPVYGKSFFHNIFQSFPTHCKISMLYHNGKPVSTGFLIAHKDVLEIPWASTLKKANNMQANMWLYWNILKSAIEKGYRSFDFGRSSKDSNTYRFKKQWGAKPVEHFWYYIMEDGESLPEINPNNPKYKLLIATWKRLPLPIANLIGPWIAKDLP